MAMATVEKKEVNYIRFCRFDAKELCKHPSFKANDDGHCLICRVVAVHNEVKELRLEVSNIGSQLANGIQTYTPSGS